MTENEDGVKVTTKPVSTTSGLVSGKKTDHGYDFLGIPYAHAERFKKPVPAHWEGVRECTKFSKRAYQIIDDLTLCDEDCLSLNIYTPDLYGSYPVIVDIHGGGFQGGCNAGPYSHPERFLYDQRVIYVPIQYRLGVWGYLYLGEALGEDYAASGNNGTLDQIAALRWVKDNIAAFGGDPDNITVMGNSAGAKAIGSLITREESNDLFNRIILISGSSQCIRTPETAAVNADKFTDILGCKAEDLLTMSNEKLIEGQQKFTEHFATCLFGPVSDGIVIPKDWKEKLQTKTAWHGSALIGTNRRECFNYYEEVPDFLSHVDEVIDGLFGLKSSYVRKAFAASSEGKSLDDEEKAELWLKLISDFNYRTHADRTAKTLSEGGMNVWSYSFEWLPAYHDKDRLFLWNELDWETEGISEDKIPAASKLSKQIYEAFIAFAVNGNPNHQGLPHLDPVTPERLTKWMFGEDTYVKEWTDGEVDSYPDFPVDYYSLTGEDMTDEEM